MSAFVVSKTHIAALSNYYVRKSGRQFSLRERIDLANMLMAENVKSVNARYDHDEEPETFEADEIINGPSYDAVTILKAAQCYSYQSCEHDGWMTSEAHDVIEFIKSMAISALPGYDEAPWEIEDPVLMNIRQRQELVK